MNKLLLVISFLLSLFSLSPEAGAQTNPPNINYPTPQNYKVNTGITPLLPQNTGGAALANAYRHATIVAESGMTGSANGRATTASFTHVRAITADMAGIPFIAEVNFRFNRKLAPASTVSAIAGSRSIATDIALANAAPTITASTASGSISSCAGSPSASPQLDQITVSGSSLTADITATAPAGFEVSLAAGSGFGNSVTLTQTSGTVNNTVVYVRSAASATGSISGNVTFSSLGATDQAVGVTGIVNALPTVNAVVNQVRVNGAATAAVNFIGTGYVYTWVNNTPGIGLPASGTGNIASFPVVNNGPTPIIATITVTPLSGGYAYIANFGSNILSVINTATNSVVATITVGHGPIGVSVSPDGKWVYVTNLFDSTVSVIETATNTLKTTISVGSEPYSLSVSPDGKWVYVANFGDGVSVINTTTYTVSTLTAGSGPAAVAVSPDGKTIYVSNNSDNTISVINTATNTSTTVRVGLTPYGITVSPDGSKVYVANANSDNITVINTSDNSIAATIQVGTYPLGVVISSDGSTLYVANDHSGSVSVIDTKSNTVSGTFQAGASPFGVSLSQDGTLLYVTSDQNVGSVAVINTSDGSTKATIMVGPDPISFGNFVTSSGGCSGTPIQFTIEADPSPAPTITATGALSAITTTYGTASPSTSFTVSGANMTAGILVTPPSGFEVSTDNVTFSSTVTVGAAGTISSTTVYIRLKSTAPAGNYSGNVVLSSSGAANINIVTAISTVNPAPLMITASSVAKPYGTALTPGTGSTAFIPTGLQNSETIGSVTITYGAGSAATDPGGTYTGSVIASAATGGTFNPANYTITYTAGDIIVSSPPTIVASTSSLSPLTTIYGSASPSTSFSISGTDMTAGILVTPPPGFEVSTDNVTFSSTVTVGSAGTISSTAVYVRLKSTDPVGSYSGDIVLTSTNAANVNVATATSTVNPAPLTITLDNVTKTYGTALNSGTGSTAFTPTGLKNKETIGSITVTYGPGAAANATAITYTGSVTGSAATGGTFTAANYTITYLPGDIIVNPAQLIITADNQTITFGEPIPALTVTYNSFVNGETVAQLTTPPVITTTATSSSAPGTYSIEVNGANSPNYTITQVAGILTIKPFNPPIVIPNTFTPNGDGINDVWNIKSLSDYPDCSVSIYTRYGSLIYQSHGYPKPWDGTYNGSALPTGTYYYIINLQNGNGPLSGPVTIIR